VSHERPEATAPRPSDPPEAPTDLSDTPQPLAEAGPRRFAPPPASALHGGPAPSPQRIHGNGEPAAHPGTYGAPDGRPVAMPLSQLPPPQWPPAQPPTNSRNSAALAATLSVVVLLALLAAGAIIMLLVADGGASPPPTVSQPAATAPAN
jgi:hypothetical protein